MANHNERVPIDLFCRHSATIFSSYKWTNRLFLLPSVYSILYSNHFSFLPPKKDWACWLFRWHSWIIETFSVLFSRASLQNYSVHCFGFYLMHWYSWNVICPDNDPSTIRSVSERCFGRVEQNLCRLGSPGSTSLLQQIMKTSVDPFDRMGWWMMGLSSGKLETLRSPYQKSRVH